MTESDRGLDACTDDPAIQPLVVVTRHFRLQKKTLTFTSHKGEHEDYTHLRLKRTRVLLVIVAGPTVSFPWKIFRHVCETPGRRDPMMSSVQPVHDQEKRGENERDIRIYQHRHGSGLTSQVRLVEDRK